MHASSARVFVLALTAVAVFLVGASTSTSSLSAQALQRELYVSVLTPAGTPATDLTASEFLVREDGISREVLRAVPATDPLQVALVVDNSAAAENDIPDLRDALKAFAQALTIGHEIAVITTGDRPTIVCDYTGNRAQIDKAIGSVFARTGSGSYMMEALIEVAKGFQKRETTRPTIIAISTEGPELSDQHETRVLSALAESGAAFHGVMLTTAHGDILSENARIRGAVFDRGARTTGGRRDSVLTSQALPDRLRALAAELSKQYKVTYARPDTLVPPQSVSVAVTRAGYEARGNPVRTSKGGA